MKTLGGPGRLHQELPREGALRQKARGGERTVPVGKREVWWQGSHSPDHRRAQCSHGTEAERAKRTVRQGARALLVQCWVPSGLEEAHFWQTEKGYLWVSGVSFPLLDPSGRRCRPQYSEQRRRFAGIFIISRGERQSPNSPEPPKPKGERQPLSRGQVEVGGGTALPMQEEGAGGQGAAGGQSGAGDYV